MHPQITAQLGSLYLWAHLGQRLEHGRLQLRHLLLGAALQLRLKEIGSGGCRWFGSENGDHVEVRNSPIADAQLTPPGAYASPGMLQLSAAQFARLELLSRKNQPRTSAHGSAVGPAPAVLPTSPHWHHTHRRTSARTSAVRPGPSCTSLAYSPASSPFCHRRKSFFFLPPCHMGIYLGGEGWGRRHRVRRPLVCGGGHACLVAQGGIPQPAGQETATCTPWPRKRHHRPRRRQWRVPHSRRPRCCLPPGCGPPSVHSASGNLQVT